MRKIFTPLFCFFLLSSCMQLVTKVNYVGSSFPETSNVDVFVSESAVKKPYEVIGKGYVQNNLVAPEAIQRKAIAKGKKNGADGVIIEDYFIVDNTKSVTSRTDSSMIVRQSVSSNPTVGSGFNILFIKYKEEK